MARVDEGGIQLIDRVAAVLELLSSSKGGLSRTEISEHLGLARSTAYRTLAALEGQGLVISSPSGHYRLGPRIGRFAVAAQQQSVGEIRPYLEGLCRDMNESVDLAILSGNRALLLDQVVAQQFLRTVGGVGASMPLHCTARGKALLAELADNAVARLLPAKLPRFTDRTLLTLTELRSELRGIRQGNPAFDREEFLEGACAVATTFRGTPMGPVAISLHMPAQRFYGREDELAEALTATVDKMNAAFQSWPSD